MRLTLEIVAKTLFDADVSGDSADASAAMETPDALLHRPGQPWSCKLPELRPDPDQPPAPPRGRPARPDHLRHHRRAAGPRGEDRGDLLSMLLHAQDEDGGGRMTDRQLRDEAMTLFMAGHETTANTLAWVWYLLSTHPEVEAKLHAELDDVLGDRPPTFDDLPRLPYTEQVVTEALRLYPTVWLLGREAIEPTEVGGYPVPVGTTVYMSQWVIHRDPRFFDDPLAYPPRALGRRPGEADPPLRLFPVRRRAEDLHRQRLRHDGGRPPAGHDRPAVPPGAGPRRASSPLPTMTLRPEHGVKVVLHERRK